MDASHVDQYAAYFDPVRVVFKGEDGPIAYHLLLRFYMYSDNSVRVLTSAGGWYEGMVDIGGKKRRVQVFDENANGTFNDQSLNAYECDRVLVEGDKGGERFLGRMLEVDGVFYRVEVARDGAFIKLQKAENVALGQVRVPENISEFVAFGENGHFIRNPVNGQFTLPVGKYRIYSWTINRKDEKGAAWTLTGSQFNEASSFNVAAEKPAALDIGEPVRTVLQIAEATNRDIAFNLRLQGKLGESIQMLRGGERPKGPRLTLTNLDGSFHYTNSFEFG
jgi:hypothetical protein